MKTHFDIEKFVKEGQLKNELDLERALIADRKLRILSKENQHFKILRRKLRELIEQYEASNWSDIELINDEQIIESDLAESIAENERRFIEERKRQIKVKLKEKEITQQELGLVLGHKSKTHMSELMNGISPFSLKDLVIINRLLEIEISNLIPLFLSEKEQKRVTSRIKELNKPGLRFQKNDMALT